MSTDREIAHGLGMSVDTYTQRWPPPPQRSAGVYDVTDKQFGQTSGTERTAAFLRARDACVATGGVIFVPGGAHILRAPVWFPMVGTGNGDKSVYVRGVGPGASEILWNPAQPYWGADCLTWGQADKHYYYGGISDVVVRSMSGGATGKLVYLKRVIRPTVRDIDVREQHAGKGLVIDTESSQNILIDNVECASNGIGFECTGVGQMTLLNFRLNQNHARGAVLRSVGGLTWCGGMIQGGDSDAEGNIIPGSIMVELGSVAGSASLNIHGPVWIESACETMFECVHVARLGILGATWLGRVGQRLVHAPSGARGIVIDGVDARAGTKLVRGRNRVYGRIMDAVPDADKYDLDSSCRLELYRDPAHHETAQPAITGAVWR